MFHDLFDQLLNGGLENFNEGLVLLFLHVHALGVCNQFNDQLVDFLSLKLIATKLRGISSLIYPRHRCIFDLCVIAIVVQVHELLDEVIRLTMELDRNINHYQNEIFGQRGLSAEFYTHFLLFILMGLNQVESLFGLRFCRAERIPRNEEAC